MSQNWKIVPYLCKKSDSRQFPDLYIALAQAVLTGGAV
jgi:hypothetical protein